MSDGDRSDGEEADDRFGDESIGDGSGDEAADPFTDPDPDAGDDPFAALGEAIDDAGEVVNDTGEAIDDAGEGADETGEATPRTDPEPAAPADDPFAELDADASGAPTDEDPFESMGSGNVGEEDVWEALDEGTSVGADAAEFDAVGTAASDSEIGGPGTPDAEVAGPTPGGGATGDERVVDKRSYCQQCPHFTAPPETACTHEGTEIVESVDFSRFRVRNCPIVDAEDPAFDGE